MGTPNEERAGTDGQTDGRTEGEGDWVGDGEDETERDSIVCSMLSTKRMHAKVRRGSQEEQT